MWDKNLACDKILRHLPTVCKWFNGENPFPITLELDPSNICNHACPGCAGGITDHSILSAHEMIQVIQESEELGTKAITFTGGGEPLCNDSTVEAICLAKKTGLDVALITNGTLLDRVDTDSLLDSCTWVRISLDAGTDKLFKVTHGVNGFNRIVNNIEALVNKKRKSQYSCTIGVGYLTGKGTNDFKDMQDFVDLAINLGVDYAQFRPYHSAGRQNLFEFKPIDFSKLAERSTEQTSIICSKHKYDAMSEGGDRKYKVCYGHQFAGVVTATGAMTLCCHTRGLSDFTFGDIRKQSLSDIWDSYERKEAIKRINLSKCPLYCRADTFNEILWLMREPREHENFL